MKNRGTPRRVIIVSANPLFREGLRKMYGVRWGDKAIIVETPATMDDTLKALDAHKPDLVILDHDDKKINRDEFLDKFVGSETPMQVMLLSLKESGQVVIYNRRSMTPAQAENWLNDPWNDQDQN